MVQLKYKYKRHRFVYVYGNQKPGVNLKKQFGNPGQTTDSADYYQQTTRKGNSFLEVLVSVGRKNTPISLIATFFTNDSKLLNNSLQSTLSRIGMVEAPWLSEAERVSVTTTTQREFIEQVDELIEGN